MYSYVLTLYNLFSHLSALENNLDLSCPINEQRTKWNITFPFFCCFYCSFHLILVHLCNTISIHLRYILQCEMKQNKCDNTSHAWVCLKRAVKCYKYINIAMTYTLPDFQMTSKSKLNVQQSCFKKCLVKRLSDMSYRLTATLAGT